MRIVNQAVHWPTLKIAGSLAGLAVVGLLGAAWSLTRPERRPDRVVAERPSRALLETSFPAPVPAEPEPAPLVLAANKPAAQPADLTVAPFLADPALEELAAAKPVPAESALPEVAQPAEPLLPRLVAPLAPECPAGECGVHGTKVQFASSASAAARQAKEQDKLLLVMHISGHFEDAAFT